MKKTLKCLKEIGIVFCVLVTITVLGFTATHLSSVKKVVRTVYLMERVALWDVEEKQVVDGAVSGMLSSLDDKYTAYIPEKSADHLMQQVSGNVYGIGVYIAEDENNRLIFVGTIPEGPAEAAGIEAGDELIQVDDTDMTGKTADDATALLRGSSDTQVEVKIRRGEEIKSFSLTRYKIGTVKTTTGTLLEDHPDIAYMRIRSFSAQTASEFASVANDMREDGYRGMILDLRDNGGGEVNAAISIARFFVESGPIVHVVYGNGKTDIKSATGAQLHIPLVVLVNENTASASEILSAALKESGRATLVGTRTFGKGLVQGIYFYEDGSAAKVTEAKYLTPNQNDINGTGIQPNIQVENISDSDRDLQLEKAIQVLQKEMNSK